MPIGACNPMFCPFRVFRWKANALLVAQLYVKMGDTAQAKRWLSVTLELSGPFPTIFGAALSYFRAHAPTRSASFSPERVLIRARSC